MSLIPWELWYHQFKIKTQWFVRAFTGSCRIQDMQLQWYIEGFLEYKSQNAGFPSQNMVLFCLHYNGVIMSAITSQITGSRLLTQPFVQAQIKENIKAPRLAFVGGIHWWPVNSPHKGPVTRKMFPFDGVIMVRFAWNLGRICTYKYMIIYHHASYSMDKTSCYHVTKIFRLVWRTHWLLIAIVQLRFILWSLNWRYHSPGHS